MGVALAISAAAPASAKKGGIPAHAGNPAADVPPGLPAPDGPPGQVKKQQAALNVTAPAAAAPVVTAPAAKAPKLKTPVKRPKLKGLKLKAQKVKGPKVKAQKVKPPKHRVNAAAPPAAAAPVQQAAAPAAAPVQQAAAPAAAPGRQPARRARQGGGSTRSAARSRPAVAARARARLRQRATAPVVPGVRRSGSTAAGGRPRPAAGGSATRIAGPRTAARRARAPVAKHSGTKLFSVPSLRDLATAPAVTRLVKVVPGFVWLILGGLLLVAALLGAALGIQARRLRRTAERADALAGLAATDPLTGLLNRRGLEASLGAELARARRYGGTLALVFGDLRSLKAINDRHGHKAGDHALRSIAEILRSQAREGDVCGRVGGDEYAVVLVNQTAAGAEAFCGRVRKRLQEQQGPGGAGLDLTMGISFYPRDGETPAELLTAADRDLYAQRGIKVVA